MALDIRFFKSLWGMEHLPISAAVEQIEAAGFDGIETVVDVLPRLREAGYRHPVVAMLFVEDADGLRAGIEKAIQSDAEAVNVHAGKGWWDFHRGCLFFEEALEVIDASPVPVTFETHRGRLLFEPQSCGAYLRKFPQLRLTADFSHWTCVCESMLQDQEDEVSLAIEQTSFLHARVGHEEGPQVPDPRAARWEPKVASFELWWDRIVEAHQARGESVLRVDPEFGPPDYLWTDPADGKPLADLFDVCVWMRDRLRERWSVSTR